MKIEEIAQLFLRNFEQRILKKEDLSEINEKLIHQEAKMTLDLYRSTMEENPGCDFKLLVKLFLQKRDLINKISKVSYPALLDSPANRFCLQLAELCSQNNAKILKLLMPSVYITGSFNPFGEDENIPAFGTFIFADSLINTGIGPVIDVKKFMSLPLYTIKCLLQGEKIPYDPLEKPQLHHFIPKKYLTNKEIKRLKNFSTTTKYFFNEIEKVNNLFYSGVSPREILKQLINKLKEGGIAGNGREENASEIALAGVAEFFIYWNSLPKEEQEKIGNCQVVNGSDFGRSTSIKDVLVILEKPKKNDIKSCVDTNYRKLEDILKNSNNQTVLDKQSDHLFLLETVKELKKYRSNIIHSKDAYLGQDSYETYPDEVIYKYLLTIKTLGEVFNLLDVIRLENISETTKDYFYYKMKDFLRYPKDFITFFKKLKFDECKEAADVFKDQIAVTFNSIGKLTTALDDLNYEKGNLLYLSLLDRLEVMITNPDEYRLLCSCLSEEERALLFVCLKNSMYRIILNATQFNEVLTTLSSFQHLSFLNALGSHLSSLFLQPSQVIDAIRLLDEPYKIIFLERINVQLFDILKKGSNLGTFLKELSDHLFNYVIFNLNLHLEKLVENAYDLERVAFFLKEDHFLSFYSAIENHIPFIIKDQHELNFLASRFSNSQFYILLKDLENYLRFMIIDPFVFMNIYSNSNHRCKNLLLNNVSIYQLLVNISQFRELLKGSNAEQCKILTSQMNAKLLSQFSEHIDKFIGLLNDLSMAKFTTVITTLDDENLLTDIINTPEKLSVFVENLTEKKCNTLFSILTNYSAALKIKLYHLQNICALPFERKCKIFLLNFDNTLITLIKDPCDLLMLLKTSCPENCATIMQILEPLIRDLLPSKKDFDIVWQPLCAKKQAAIRPHLTSLPFTIPLVKCERPSKNLLPQPQRLFSVSKAQHHLLNHKLSYFTVSHTLNK